MASSTALSLCMIVKNEERNLAACLESVRELGPEIVVVDTGSTDGTISIAADHGARTSSYDFGRIDFAAARNQALAMAQGQWIMVLDADERVDAESIGLVRQLSSGAENVGYYFERVNHYPDPDPATSDYVVRLFPNRPEIRYRGRVHETVEATMLSSGGRLLRSGIRIHHNFAVDPEARRRRNLWYIGILKEEIAADPTDHSRLTFLAAEYHQLGMFAEATEVAEKIALLRPLDPEAHLHAGVYHLLFKVDLKRARQDLLEALRLKPGYPEALSFVELLREKESGDASGPGGSSQT